MAFPLAIIADDVGRLPSRERVLGLDVRDVIDAIFKSSEPSRALSSNSFSRWATISSWEPFSCLAILNDLLIPAVIFHRGDCQSFSERGSQTLFLPLELNSFKKSGTFVVLGSNTRRCQLCLAVAYDSSLTYLRLKMTNTSSRVCLLAVLMFLNVCNALFPQK